VLFRLPKCFSSNTKSCSNAMEADAGSRVSSVVFLSKDIVEYRNEQSPASDTAQFSLYMNLPKNNSTSATSIMVHFVMEGMSSCWGKCRRLLAREVWPEYMQDPG